MYLPKRLGVLIGSLTLLTLACALTSSLGGQQVAEDDTISVVINSPSENTEVAVGQEIMVQITINDPAGVVNQQELRVDGVPVATSGAVGPEGAPAFSIIMPYTPTQQGTFVLSAVASGSDGSVSEPASVSIVVTGDGTEPVDEAPQNGAEEPDTGGDVPPPSPTSTPSGEQGCTNGMSYVSDVTIPDGTIFDPGAAFTKTWQIQNSGTCDWGGYQLVFAGDSQMGGPSSVTVPATSAGQNINVSVNLTAPTTPGTYKSTWTMRSSDGDLFGSRIFAEIVVRDPDAEDKPDLIITGVTTDPIDPIAGSTAAYNVTVKNQGTADTGDFVVRADFEGLGISGLNTSGLVAGDSKVVPLSATAPAGTLNVTFTVDADSEIDESDEGNNVRVESFEVVVILASGSFDVGGNSSGTLDTGATDFLWDIQNSTERRLVPENGATFAVMGTSQVGFADCSSASLSNGNINASDPDYSDMPVGSWVCAKTSDGRFSAFRIDLINPAINYRMTISYTTYE